MNIDLFGIPWNPANLSNLLTYINPKIESTIVTSSGKLSNIDPVAGSTGPWFQTAAGRMPIYDSAQIEGHQALQFTGAQYLDFTETLNLRSKAFFMVVLPTGVPTSEQALIASDSRRDLFEIKANNKLNYNSAQAYWAPVDHESTGSITRGSAAIVGAIGDTSLHWHINGATEFNTAGNDGSGWDSYHRFGVQQNSGNLSKFYQGYLGAAVLTSSIPTQSQIDMISGFLAHEYSMTSVLPGAHPYKTAAPTVFGDYESAVYTVNSNDNLSVIAKDVTGTIKFKVTMPDGDTMYLIKYGQEVEFTDEDFTELLWLRQGDQIQIEQIGGTTPAVVTISGGVSLADGSGVSSGGATVLTGSLIG